MRVGRLLALLAAGCFNPNLGEGGFPCASDGACPADFTCKISTCWPAKTAEQCEGVASISGNSTICPDAPLTLSASAGERIRWSTGADTSSIQVTAPGTYRVVVDGCEAPPVTVTQAVLQLPPVISVVGGATSFCPGSRDSITLTTADEQPSYLWSNGATTREITVTEPGSYSVTSQECFTSQVVEIKAAIEPIITTTCEGNYYTLVAPEAASYAWSNGDGSRSIAPFAPGDYTVTVDGCLTSAPVTVPASEVPTITFEYTGVVDTFTVPTCPTSIIITAAGAEGGGKTAVPRSDNGGDGRIIRGTFAVTPGEALSIVVGGRGGDGNCYGTTDVVGRSGGGGGGSFVWRPADPAEPLIAAGGGGGAGADHNTFAECSNFWGAAGNSTTPTENELAGYVSSAVTPGAAGMNGGGGGAGTYNGVAGYSNYGSSGGGGWKSAGTNGAQSVGGGAGAGGVGGNFAGGAAGFEGSGGFGGGGGSVCAGGGGGGYSGGGGGEGSYNFSASTGLMCGAGGGGSYNAGTSPAHIGFKTGHGQVTISW